MLAAVPIERIGAAAELQPKGNGAQVEIAAKRGDQDAWRELYRAHAGRLVVWLETRSGTDGAVAAEDVAAQAWLTGLLSGVAKPRRVDEWQIET